MRRYVTLVFALLMLFPLSSLSSAVSAPQRGGTLLYGLRDEPDRLDPNLTTLRTSQVVFFQIFDTLIVRDERDKSFKPWLAASWAISADGRMYTFKIRPGVKFHDGTAFDAASVKYNFDRTHDPKLASRCGGCAAGFYDSSTVVDPMTVQIHLKQPWAPFLDAVSLYYRMVSPTAVDRYGNQDFGRHPVGTGPFKFVEWVPSDHITIERSDEYHWAPSIMKHTGPAYLTRVIFRLLPEDGTRVAALDKGEVQVIDFAPPQDFARLTQSPSFKPLIGLPPGIPFNFSINVTKPPTNELAVRQAINYGVDRPAIARTVFGPFQKFGAFHPAYGLLNPNTWGYDAGAKKYLYNPTKAKALLEEAGWKLGPNGIRQKNGMPLTIPLGSWLHGVPEVMQAQLAQIGVNLKLIIAEQAAVTLVNENQRKGVTLLSPLPAPRSDPGILSGVFHSRNVGGGGFNYSFVRDPELDRLLDAQAAELNEVKRAQILSRVQRLAMDRAYMLPVYEQDYISIRSAGVNGLYFEIGSFPLLYDTWVSSK